ncbi:MAG: ATP-binding protein [Candidatus Saccharimonadales bacterium]
MMLTLKINQKLLLLLLVVSLLPLGLVNLYWYRATQSSLRSEAVDHQKILTNSAVYRVNQYMTDKVNALIIHSQTAAVRSLSPTNAHQDLSSLIKQDSDIQTLTLANPDGQVVISMDRNSDLPTTANVSDQDAFRATTFLSGREYISPVSFSDRGHPTITIAAPLVKFTSGQDLLNLSTANSNQVRTPQQITGVLIETVDLTGLWQGVLSQGTNNGGYMYVVDGEGTLITYPDVAFQKSHQNLSKSPAVNAFLKNPEANPNPKMLTSEKGESVLSSYSMVARTNWGVITIEPAAAIFALANHVAVVGLSIFAIAALLVATISYFVSRQVTIPIRRLAAGTALISQGRLDTRVAIDSRDEIGTLATSFNTMAHNLGVLLQRTQAESNKANIILGNVSEGIVAINIAGNIILANRAAAELLGDLPPNLIGKPLASLYHWSMDNRPFSPSLTEQEFYPDITLTNSNHRIYYIDMMINPVADDPTGIHAIITIIDKTGEQELENMKVDFVSMAAHELRTPLTAIRGYLDLITHDETVSLSDKMRNYIGNMEASSMQLVSLIRNLLNVSRVERNELTISREKVDWAKTLQKAMVDLQFTAETKSITLTYEGPVSDVYLLAEQITMLEVINNLISNAINYTDSGGKVAVKLRQTDDKVITEISDNGIGIPANSLEHLFTKFYRVRSGLPSGSGGTGLGLYISKSIVELHGGELTVTSVENEGSTFSIVLPKFDEAAYNEIIRTTPNRLNQKHGWTTKNTTR